VPYVEGRVVHDADAHVMETSDWILPYVDPEWRDRIGPLVIGAVGDADQRIADDVRRSHEDPDWRATEAEEILVRKNWRALGATIAEDRPRALDHLGFASQLIFNTFMNGHVQRLEHGDDQAMTYATARAHNRAMLDFCSVDRRLLPTALVPLSVFEDARRTAESAVADGAAALLVSSAPQRGHSPSHVDLDPVWAVAQEAGVPIVFHVGGGGRLLDPAYFRNGLPVPPDFHGGDENFRSVDYMAIPGPPAQTLATMVFDGVLERFPDLRIGVIEQGAVWVPSWTRQMESAFEAFARHEERLQALSLRPGEYVRRQVRFTPYPTEDVGWIIEQAGPEVVLFSSDYPHVEGGRRPVERFEASLGDAPEAVRQAFYCDNFVDLMGCALTV
jgi:uncharacterized protein